MSILSQFKKEYSNIRKKSHVLLTKQPYITNHINYLVIKKDVLSILIPTR